MPAKNVHHLRRQALSPVTAFCFHLSRTKQLRDGGGGKVRVQRLGPRGRHGTIKRELKLLERYRGSHFHLPKSTGSTVWYVISEDGKVRVKTNGGGGGVGG